MRLLPLMLLLAACRGGGEPAEQSATNPPARDSARFSGTVTETLSSGGYTYARIESAGESIWAAAPQTLVAVGDLLTVSTSMPMENFHSETLDCQFDGVYFVQSFSDKLDMSNQPKPATERADVHVQPAEGEIAIADLWAQRETLEGKEVQLRGKLGLDRDFGAGYVYEVMLEDASVSPLGH